MTFILSFEIPDLPKMANPSGAKSTHWRYAQKEVKKWRALVLDAVGSNGPKSPIQKAQLILTRHSSVAPDYDGLVRGFKSVVDGLCYCGVLEDDRLENTGIWDCRWQRAPRGKGKISVEVRQWY